jgi:hypothetical protein
MNKLEVAQTILDQLGGNRFVIMSGAKNLGAGTDYLSFGLGRNAGKVSHVIVKYVYGKDLYEMTFLSIRGTKTKTIASFEDVYSENLQEIFTEVTGLLITL